MCCSSLCVLQFPLCCASEGKTSPRRCPVRKLSNPATTSFKQKKQKKILCFIITLNLNSLCTQNPKRFTYSVHTKPQRIYLFCAHKTPKDLPILCTQNPKGLPYCHSLCTQNPKGFTYSYKTPKDFYTVTVCAHKTPKGLPIHIKPQRTSILLSLIHISEPTRPP